MIKQKKLNSCVVFWILKSKPLKLPVKHSENSFLAQKNRLKISRWLFGIIFNNDFNLYPKIAKNAFLD